MVPQQPRNPNLPDLNNPLAGLQGGGVQAGATPAADATMAGASPAPAFGSQQDFAAAQFSGAGAQPQDQSMLALTRDQDARRQATMGSDAAFQADLQRRADETYAEFERTLNPQWETRAREFEQSLIGRGIDPNSEAGRNARAQFDQSRTDAFSQARRAANADGQALQQQRWQQQFAQQQADTMAEAANAQMGANLANMNYNRDWAQRQFDEDRRRYDQGFGFQRDQFGEDIRRYDQGFDFNMGQADFGMLMQMLGMDQGMAGFNNNASGQELNSILPWLSMIPQGGPTGIDVMSPYNMQQQAQQFNAQQQQQRSNGFWGSVGQIAGAAIPLFSDERVKHEIRQVGTLHNGLPVYAYRYKWGGPTQLGVMAQDVEKVNPEAVIEVEGIKMVNYDMAVA